MYSRWYYLNIKQWFRKVFLKLVVNILLFKKWNWSIPSFLYIGFYFPHKGHSKIFRLSANESNRWTIVYKSFSKKKKIGEHYNCTREHFNTTVWIEKKIRERYIKSRHSTVKTVLIRIILWVYKLNTFVLKKCSPAID